ncbi:hypothetical protein BSKO_06781 [Bryopsis sp. KO-2023]|nr:hypothetical protein BSKO_06781 [Bryopsis sp. KO-2023]
MTGAPLKPWETNPVSSTSGRSSTPLGPSTSGQKPWENPSLSSTSTITPTISNPEDPQQDNNPPVANRTQPGNTLGQSSALGNPYSTGYRNLGGGYGGYNSYNSYGGYGGYGGSYGGMYGGRYMGNSGLGYRGGYSSPYGGMYGGGYGMGMQNNQGLIGNQMGGPNGEMTSGVGPPSAWQSFLNGLQRVVETFGRMSFLVDENAQAIHFFISALLQLLDRVGSLYGETARLVLRILGYKKPKEKNAVDSKQPAGSTANVQEIGESNFNKASLNAAWQDSKK